MKARIIAGVLALSLVAGAAQAMTVQEFLTTAAGIPQNPTALLRSDTRRLMGEFRGAARTVRAEQTAATAAGRTPATCMPDKVGFSPDEILGRFNTIPQARRNISVTQAMREWMIEKYPCPAKPARFDASRLKNSRSPTGWMICPRSRRRPGLTQARVRDKALRQ